MRRWGLLVHRHRWAVLIVCGVFFVASVVALLNGGELKNASDFNVESVRASKLESNQLPAATGTSFLVLFTDSQRAYSDPLFQHAVQDALSSLARDHRVTSIQTPYNADPTAAAAMVSTDRHSVFSVVNLSLDFASARQQ